MNELLPSEQSRPRCVWARRVGVAGLVLTSAACNGAEKHPKEATGTAGPEPVAADQAAFRTVAPTMVAIPDAAFSLGPSFGRDESEGKVWLTWLAGTGTGGVVVWAAALADPLSPVKVVEGTHVVGNPEEVPRILPVGDTLFSAYVVEPYEIRLTRSDDHGKTWTAPVVPHTGTAEAFALPALFPMADGVGLGWIQEGSVRVGGLRADGAARTPEVLDPRVCECCKVDVAVATDGPVVAYRDRSETEVRDISLVRRNGDTWSTPTATISDEWTINGCPVNGPALGARGDRLVLVSFSGKQTPGRVEAALSSDGGETFAGGLRLDAGQPLGRVDVVWAEHDAIASWLERDAEHPDRARLLARRIRSDRTLGPITQLADVAASHESGFPELTVTSESLWWTWTGVSEAATPIVKLAHIALADVP